MYAEFIGNRYQGMPSSCYTVILYIFSSFYAILFFSLNLLIFFLFPLPFINKPICFTFSLSIFSPLHVFSSFFSQVFFASAAPPVRFSNVYGIDIPTRTELIAHNRTESEIGTFAHDYLKYPIPISIAQILFIVLIIFFVMTILSFSFSSFLLISNFLLSLILYFPSSIIYYFSFLLHLLPFVFPPSLFLVPFGIIAVSVICSPLYHTPFV